MYTYYTHYTIHILRAFFYQTNYNVKINYRAQFSGCKRNSCWRAGTFLHFIFKQAIYKFSAEIVRSLFCTEDNCARQRDSCSQVKSDTFFVFWANKYFLFYPDPAKLFLSRTKTHTQTRTQTHTFTHTLIYIYIYTQTYWPL